MKVPAVKKAAQAYSAAQLEAAIEAITEREEELLDVDGDDMEERLTHLLLAQRIVTRVEAGEAFKDVVRQELGAVRDILAND
ncbi:MAG: hypothetical protein H6733_00670 [Alphaproteobacteria bacterium]|nr:hypothetical protein [Alphaproteobacteria bacterium]